MTTVATLPASLPFILADPGQPGPIPAVVKETPFSAIANTTFTQAVTSTAGNVLALVFSMARGSSTAGITGVTDSAGNTWQKIDEIYVSGQNTYVAVWYTLQDVDAISSITVTTSTSFRVAWSLLELNGINRSSAVNALRAHTTNKNNPGTTTPLATTVSVQASDIIIGGINAAFTATPSVSVSPPFTPGTVQGFGVGSPYSVSAPSWYVAATAGVYGPSYTLSESGISDTITVAFAAGSGAIASPHFTGAGALTAVSAIQLLVTAAFSGTGILATSGAARVTAAVALTGAGTLSASSTGTVSSTIRFTGSGVLTATGAPRTTATVSLTGSGQLSSTRGINLSAGAVFTGNGALSAATVTVVVGAAGLSGVGVLAATAGAPTGSTVVGFGGEGTFTATGDANQIGAAGVNFASVGSLMVEQTLVTQSVDVAFSGDGALAAERTTTSTEIAAFTGDGIINIDIERIIVIDRVNFTGFGALTGDIAGIAVTGQDAFTGRGMLTVTTGRSDVTGMTTFSGIGQLSAHVILGLSNVSDFTGSGALTAAYAVNAISIKHMPTATVVWYPPKVVMKA